MRSTDIRARIEQNIRGSIFNIAFKAGYCLDEVDLHVCRGCCNCYMWDQVLITVTERGANRRRAFLIRMTVELAARTAAQYICEQIVKILKQGDTYITQENQPIETVNIFEESNAKIERILDAAERIDELEAQDARQRYEKSATNSDGTSRFR